MTLVDQNSIRINDAAYIWCRKQRLSRYSLQFQCDANYPAFRANPIHQNECRKNAQFRGDKDSDNGDNWCKLCRGNLIFKIVSWKIRRNGVTSIHLVDDCFRCVRRADAAARARAMVEQQAG